MESFFIRSWWVPALRGVLGILFGVLAIALPGVSLLALVALFAAWAMLAGGASIAGALRHRRGEDDWLVAFLLGAVSVGAGVVAILNPGLTALVLVLVIGANALVTGTLDILAAARLRRAVADEWLLVLSGLASMAFGAIVFLYPGAGALALVWLVSLYAVVTGGLLLGMALRVRWLAPRAGLGPERRVHPDRRMSLAR